MSWEARAMLAQVCCVSLLYLLCCTNNFATGMLICVRDVPCALTKQTRGPLWLGSPFARPPGC